MNTWNVHRTFITYIHRTLKSRNTKNTYNFLVQVRNLLLPLSLKVLRHKERDAHSFYSGFSICPPPNTCGTRHKATASERKLPFFFGPQDSTNWLFSNFPKSSAHASGAWRHSHPQVLSGFLFWHFWMTHPPRVRINICAQVCTELTHVLSRKVLSLTKPKGKIYKTKSLGLYITRLPKRIRDMHLRNPNHDDFKRH